MTTSTRTAPGGADRRSAGFTAEHHPGDPGRRRPTVVFVPALFAGRWIWDAPSAVLREQGWPVVRVNEPICTAEGPVAASIERLGDAVLALCDDAGAEQLVLCANSMGGMVAIDLARRFPDRVVGIVVSGAPGLTPDPDIGLRLDQRSGGWLLTGPEFEERMLAALFHSGRHLDDAQLAEVGALLEQPAAMVAVARGIRATRSYPVAASLAAVTCPALFLWGAHDRMTPVEPWVGLVADHPSGELVLVPGCGHIPMIEAAEDYGTQLLAFVGRLAGEVVGG